MSQEDYAVRGYLPRVVYDLAIRLGASSDHKATTVRLSQTGRMKSGLDSKTWTSFTASQTISTHTCEFDWKAKAGPLGLVSGCDTLASGEGRFDILALGFIPIARAKHTPALVRGEMLRYLAEIAWAPDAILHNRYLQWREIDPDNISVSAGADETASEVVLTLGSDGRIAGAFAPDRPRSAIPPLLPTPWRGQFSDYRLHKKRWLPFYGKVGWEIDGVSNIYWESHLNGWNID